MVAPSAPQPIAFDTGILQDDSEFLGVIVVDESVRGDYGPQWHYAIKPIDYDLGGTTGAYHMYIPSDRTGMRSKLGIALTQFVRVMGQGAVTYVGNGELVGRPLLFKRSMASFGKDRQTREKIEVEMILPLRLPNDDETERARSKMAGSLSTVTPASQFTEEQIAALCITVAGKNETQANSAVVKSKLDNDLKGAVLNGTALPALVAAGHLVVDEAGLYQVPDADEE